MKKTIQLFTLLLILSSCKENIKPVENTKWPNNHDKIEPYIRQHVWNYKDIYYLQTCVFTERQQTALRNHVPGQIFIPSDSYAPYNKEIGGTFEYIKAAKAIEYLKADKVRDSLNTEFKYGIVKTERQKLTTDSVTILNSIKP